LQYDHVRVEYRDGAYYQVDNYELVNGRFRLILLKLVVILSLLAMVLCGA